ncbi:MAG: response regulator [Rhodospirillaceae bacterium]|nr:response regulator [Rhodospirillaceae bacterium]
MKITIIDDDPDIIEAISLILGGAGHSVISSPAGVNAISLIRKKRPDLIITDLVMAEMDGLELCREIRKDKLLANTKIIMISARTDEMWKEKARSAGADGYIEKPIDTATFVKDVETISAL